MPVGLFSILLHLSLNQDQIKSSANQYKTPLDPERSSGHDLTSLAREEIFLRLCNQTSVEQTRVRVAHDAVSSASPPSSDWGDLEQHSHFITDDGSYEVCVYQAFLSDIFLALLSDLLSHLPAE